MEATTISQPRQFAFHERVSKEPPHCSMWNECIESDGILNREQKDRIFHSIQGNTGKGNYRSGGWIFPFGQWMKTYLVKYQHHGWQEIKAFDKTCIRSSWYTNSCIIEIIQKPE
jgi:hypothetical protein